MALKAGYYGVKKKDQLKLEKLPAFEEIGTGLQVTDDGELEATGTTLAIEPNPEGSASVDLTKLLVGETIYGIPGNDNSKCYQTDDATESAIVDADYIPFFDASAASGAGAPRKSTWSNFKTKLKAVFDLDYEPLTSISDVTVTPEEDITVHANTKVYEKGKYISGSLRLEIGTTLTAGSALVTLSKSSKGTVYTLGVDTSDGSIIPLICGTDGKVYLFGSFVPTSGHTLLIPINYYTT